MLTKEITKTVTTKYDENGKAIETKEETIERHYSELPAPVYIPQKQNDWWTKTPYIGDPIIGKDIAVKSIKDSI